MKTFQQILMLSVAGVTAPAVASPNIDWSQPVGHAIAVTCPANGPDFDFWNSKFSEIGMTANASVNVVEQDGKTISSSVTYTGNRFATTNSSETQEALDSITRAAPAGCTVRAHTAQKSNARS